MSAHTPTEWILQSNKLIIDTDVENELRSHMLHGSLLSESLPHGSIELYGRCPNLTAIGWGDQQAFCMCQSLLRVDLSGLPKLESIPVKAFSGCYHLVSVVFGEHSNITNF